MSNIVKTPVLLSVLVTIAGLSACNSGTSSNTSSSEPITPVTTIALPQSGQQIQYPTGCSGTTCHTSTLGTDGYGRLVGGDNIPYGVAWAYNGSNPLTPITRFVTDSAESDCIIDNLTGLEWPKNGRIGFISTSYSSILLTQPDYNNTDDTLNTVLWAVGMQGIKNMNSAPIKLCGYSDWRMPNVNELASLQNFGIVNSKNWLESQGITISSFFVPIYWTSTAYAPSPTSAKWGISFSRGGLSTELPNDEIPSFTSVIPVRSTSMVTVAPAQIAQTGQTISQESGDDGALQEGAQWVNSSQRFEVGSGYESDCITDKLTGLMWVRDANRIPVKGSPYPRGTTWQNAIDSANAVNSGFGICDHYDWRVPNVNELRSLINYGAETPSEWLNQHGFMNMRSNSYWVSTSGFVDPTSVYYIDFENGQTIYSGSKTKTAYFQLVRSGK